MESIAWKRCRALRQMGQESRIDAEGTTTQRNTSWARVVEQMGNSRLHKCYLVRSDQASPTNMSRNILEDANGEGILQDLNSKSTAVTITDYPKDGMDTPDEPTTPAEKPRYGDGRDTIPISMCT